MPGKAQDRRRRAASCPEVRDLAEGEALAAEAGCLQPPGDQFLASGVIRRDRRAPDEFGQERSYLTRESRVRRVCHRIEKVFVRL
jgi:hypothetical protein